MANHDYVLANQSGASFRADLNNLAQAIASLNSGTSDPSATFSVAYMLWADTSTGLLKIRNAANSAWVTLGTLASSYLGLITHSLATAKGDILAASASGAFAKLAVGSNGYRPEADSSQTTGLKWSSAAPSVQKFTTGSGTYTTPSGVKAIKIRLCGAGGGGGGSGTSTPGSGTGGGDTTFGTLTAGGGSGGAASTALTYASGGTATGGDINLPGGAGAASSNLGNVYSNVGGISAFGGAGPPAYPGGPGQAAATNSGSGGSGEGGNSGVAPGGSGGAGAYLEKLIVSPSASYSYAVGSGGSGGTAGTSGFAGGDGATGIITVEEFR